MTALFWTQRQDIGPNARFGHAVAYDSARNRTVLVGGDGVGTLFDDTWLWDGEAWTQAEDIGPSGRAEHAIAFDAARSRVVLFGGRNANPLSDTWEWDGTAWTQVADTGPSARSGHAVAYDAGRSRVVLFGGRGAGNTLLGDTWEWDGTAWTQVADTGPSPRVGHATAFDAAGTRTILFGGSTLSDTWAWNGSEWTQVNDVGPAACEGVAIASTGDGAVLFGGVDAGNALFGVTWQLSGTDWTERQDIGPVARQRHAVAYDSQRGRVVLFGGSSAAPSVTTANDLLGDTWELPAGSQGGGGGQPQGGQAPTLVSFTLNPDVADANQTVEADFQIDQPASSDVSVSLTLDGSPAGDVTITAGQTTTAITFEANVLPPGTYTFGATLGSVTLNATFTRQ
jgi:hypothetical protein